MSQSLSHPAAPLQRPARSPDGAARLAVLIFLALIAGAALVNPDPQTETRLDSVWRGNSADLTHIQAAPATVPVR